MGKRRESSTMQNTFTCALAGLLAVACVGKELTVGELNDPSAPDGVPPTGPELLDPTECRTLESLLAERGVPALSLPANFTAVAGSWRGGIAGSMYYLGYHDVVTEFPRGTIELELDGEGNGSVRFGDAPAPPSPSSRVDPYLCSGSTIAGGCRQTAEIIPGFRYSVGGSEIRTGDDGVQVSARFWLSEPWRSWCELQVPRRLDCPGDAQTCADAGRACTDYVAFPDPLQVDLGTCSVTEYFDVGAGSGPVAERQLGCDWLAAIREAPCVCAEEGCSGAGLARTLVLELSENARVLRGRLLQAPAELERDPLLLERQ